MRNHRLSLLVRYILMYFLIFALPAGILWGLFFEYSVEVRKRELNRKYRSELQRISEESEKIIGDCRQLAYALGATREFRRDIINESISNSMKALEVLKGHYERSRTLGLLAIRYREQPYILTPDGQYHAEIFSSKVAKLADWPTFAEDLVEFIVPAIRISGEGYLYSDYSTGFVIVITPVSTITTFDRDMVVVSIVSFDSLRKHVREIANDILKYVTISEGSIGRTLYLSGKQNKTTLRPSTNEYSEADNGGSTNNSTEIVFHEQGAFGLSYTVSIPITNYTTQVNVIKRKLWIIFTAVLFCGFIIAFLLAYSNYRPIRDLFTTIMGHHPNLLRLRNRGEFSSIEDAFFKTRKEADEYLNRLVLEQDLVKQQIIISLLKGTLSEDQKDIVKQLKIDLSGPYFSVIILNTGLSAFNKDAAISAIGRLQQRGHRVLFVEPVQGRNLVLILSIANKNDCDVQALAGELERECLKHGGPNQIRSGRLVNCLIDVHVSFLDALVLSEGGGAKTHPKASKVSPDNEFIDHKAIRYPDAEIERFLLCLRIGYSTAAHEQLDRIMCLVREASTLEDIQKCKCFYVLNCTIRYLCKHLPRFNGDFLSKVVSFGTVDDLEENLQKVVDWVCAENIFFGDEHELKLNITKYLSDHYLDYQLNLEMISDNFDVSVYYMSRFISKHMGANFSTLLRKWRIEKARELLSSTNLTVSEISEKVCYSNVSNFIANFKKLIGSTPAKHRKNLAS